MFGFLGLEVVEDLVDDHRVLDAGNHLHRPLALFAFGNVDVEDALQASGPGHGGPLLQRCAFLGRKVHGTDLACPLATFGRGDRYTVVAVGGEHAVEAGQVHSRFGHQRRQLRHEVQGLEDHMGGAVPVRCLEFVTYPAVSCQRQTLLRDRRARHIAAQVLQFLSFMRLHCHAGVQGEAAGLGQLSQSVVFRCFGEQGLQGEDLLALLRAEGDAVGNAVPVHLLHGLVCQVIQSQVTVLAVLGQHALLHEETGQPGAELLQYRLQIALGRRIDPAEHLAGVVVVAVAVVAPRHIHPVQEQHMKVDIQVQGRAKRWMKVTAPVRAVS